MKSKRECNQYAYSYLSRSGSTLQVITILYFFLKKYVYIMKNTTKVNPTIRNVHVGANNPFSVSDKPSNKHVIIPTARKSKFAIRRLKTPP